MSQLARSVARAPAKDHVAAAQLLGRCRRYHIHSAALCRRRR